MGDTNRNSTSSYDYLVPGFQNEKSEEIAIKAPKQKHSLAVKAVFAGVSIILGLLFIGLCLMVISLSYRVKYIEELAVMDNIYEKVMDTDYDEETYSEEIDQTDLGEDENSDRELNPSSSKNLLGIHLTGIDSTQTIGKTEGVPAWEAIENWNDASESKAHRNKLTLKTDESTMLVHESGYYMIYAQLTWRMQQGVATFEITRTNQTNPNPPESIAKCTTNFHEDYAIMRSCYTSTAANLNEGDRLNVKVYTEDFTIDYRDGKSFFGAVSLGQYQSR